MKNRLILLAVSVLASANLSAQYAWQYEARHPSKLRLQDSVHYNVEVQGSFSSDKTPLWLNANRHGLSSLQKTNGYLRGSIYRPLSTDSARRWGIGYGLDLVAAHNYTSGFIVQQAYAEVRWLHGVLTVGSKEYPMQLKNNSLSSGSQTLGINARPVPQVRLAIPEYWTLPIFNRWIHFKGHMSYGMFTDDGWQKDFTQKQSKYTHHALYHSKSGYLMIGKPEAFYPFTFEMGLEMASEFGGTSYRLENGEMKAFKNRSNLKAFYRAFIPGSGDVGEGAYANEEGNILGSWVARLNYDNDMWGASIYADHYFEDHSGQFFLDYDGYGEGKEYNVKKKHKFFLYSLKDIMLGGELRIKHGTWLRNVVLEYIYTKYQSGPVYHDRTSNISDHIAGRDNYYNHYIYTGWQHWGQVMGNPLYRSPIYNEDGMINVDNNRFVAWHLGFDGQPIPQLTYRALATYQSGYGTYPNPYTKVRHNFSFMVEASYHFPHNWTVKGNYGMDFGSILGHNHGFQLTISKGGIIGKVKK